MLKENLSRMKMKSEIIKTDFYSFKTKKKFDVVVIDAPALQLVQLEKIRRYNTYFQKRD